MIIISNGSCVAHTYKFVYRPFISIRIKKVPSHFKNLTT